MTTQLLCDVFLSVDGHGRGTRSPGYFGYLGPDLQRWIDEEAARPQCQIMGRRTYEAFETLPEEARDDGYRRMVQARTVVFSRTLSAVTWPGATLVADDARDAIPKLKADSDADLRTIGSLSLVRQLLDAGHVDRLRLMVFPLIVGETGVEPVFAGVGDSGLELVGHSVLDGRIVLSEYRRAGDPPYAG
ncbi:dihydrofolate reductase family protein [Pseudonocardia sp. CA-107938]|uniref:dihydrofolate reductase family protein n=1 Tax=Pseudonocardia sp. CA-107938 TaxID=3240021 RepID=UPI003D8CA2AA